MLKVKPSLKPACGFSLVELLVVLAILGILAVAVSGMMKGGGSGLGQQMPVLSAMLDRARSTAMSSAAPCRVLFHNDPTDPNNYRQKLLLLKASGRQPDDTIIWQEISSPERLMRGLYFQPLPPPPTAANQKSNAMRWTNGGGEYTWQYYEYGADGTTPQAGWWVVVARGTLEGSAVVIPNPQNRDGFVLRGNGGVVRVSTPAQLPSSS